MPQLGLGLRANISASSLYDGDAAAYFTRAGITDANAKVQINAFVKGVKDLGLWSSMACWTLRSAQNAGTGTTAYSLGGLGTYNGTISNSPTWGVDGITFNGNNQNIDFGSTLDFGSSTFLYCLNPSWGTLTSFTDFQIFFATHSLASGTNIKERNFALASANMTGDPTVKDSCVQLVDYSVGSFGYSGQATYNILVQNQYRFCSMQANGTTYKFYRSGSLLSTQTGNKNFDTPGNGSDYSGTRKTVHYTLVSGSGLSQNAKIPIICLIKTQLTDAQHTSMYSLYKTTIGTGLSLP